MTGRELEPMDTEEDPTMQWSVSDENRVKLEQVAVSTRICLHEHIFLCWLHTICGVSYRSRHVLCAGLLGIRGVAYV